jgi:hypothetical protein
MGGVEVRALAAHHSVTQVRFPDSSVICELSLLLILSLASRVFFPGYPVFLPP